MDQHGSSSRPTLSSQSLNRGDREYPLPTGFGTEAVQGAIHVVKQFRRGQISKAEAILEIQGNLTSGEDEPSNSELISALSSYIGILDDIEQSAQKNQPEEGVEAP